MSKPSAILAPESERAHYVAQVTLCALAGMSAAAFGWAALHGAFSGGPLMMVAPVADPPPAVSGPAAVPAPSPPVPAMGGLGATPVPPPITGVAPAPVAPGREIANAQVRDMVEGARAVRRSGDMQAALESLRAADLREPDHPEILSEMALTYEAMGLGDKAEAIWRSVLEKGEAGGGYYTLAKAKLEGREASSKSPGRNPVSLGACQIIPDPTVTRGQRLALRVPIIVAPGAEIDPARMDIHVYFYDKVGTDRIEPTRADPPTPNWVSAPVDWKDGEELVDFVYNMPELKAEELRNLGKRAFYGYVVKIFYQDRIMGVQAEPRALVDYKPPGVGPTGADSALFPKN